VVSFTLNALATRIEGRIANSPEALNIFKERLLQSRYVEHDFYDTVLFECMSIVSYAVTDDFPKLVREMVPGGVVNANYSIEITSISDFRSDISP
jgi:hypothetical protein